MAHSAAEIHKQVRIYIFVFAALAVLTVVTVGISYLHLSTPAAVAFAMLVATLKGSLVALYFMHLIDEKRAVYWLLGLTVIFFVAVMYLPSAWLMNDMRTAEVWDKLPPEGRLKDVLGSHGGDHGASEAGGAHEEGGHH
jgi:cytochrome c oxidase subunit 4